MLNVMTLNTWCLPTPLGYRVRERMERILENLAPYDLVFLQEVFHKEARQQVLSENVRQLFPFVAHTHTGTLLRQDSGLMVLSKYPITLQFQVFTKSGWPDQLAKKGLYYGKLKTPTTSMFILNTHFQSGEHERGHRLRDSNLKDLFALLPPDMPTILGGDFNFYPNSRAYQNMMEQGFCDVFAEAEGQYTVHRPENPLARSEKQRIDYLFYRHLSLRSRQRIFDEPLRGEFVSDHFGVAACLEA